MSNLHAAGFAPGQTSEVRAVHLVPGQIVCYGGLDWAVAEVLRVYPLDNVAVIAVDREGRRAVLFYANGDSKAQVVAQ